MSRSRSRLVIAVAAALVTACGSGGSADTAADTAARTDSTGEAFTGPVTSTPTSVPLVVADIDRWESGMDAELEAVRAAAATLRSATTAGDSAMAIIAMNESSTRSAGASGAGVDGGRYQFIRSTLSAAVSNLVPLEQVMDVATMPAPLVAEVRKNREAALAGMAGTLPPELLEALRARASALRAQELALATERLEAAGLGS